MNQRKRQKTILTILTVFVLVLVGVILFGFFELKNAKEENSALTFEMEQNQQTVYVATRLIERGEEIIAEGTEANVELQKIYTGMEAFNYITEEQLGTIATVDISEGVPVMYVMVAEKSITNDSREYEITAVNLTTDQDEYDIVDVRIMFPDGSDYIVLSKKEVSQLNLSNCIFTTILSEEEILRYACAIVDAYTTTGARLYTTRYVESALQEASTPNYPVREVTRQLLQTDPNVVSTAAETLNAQARIDLETRLGNLTAEELDAVKSGIESEEAKKDTTVNENKTAED